ncbi:hypothetical protein C8R46DRAFT_1119831 [Mycena filopes]|nr:hypothetical protein C8R46DRAFT_1119831 [Mycena filopes]
MRAGTRRAISSCGRRRLGSQATRHARAAGSASGSSCEVCEVCWTAEERTADIDCRTRGAAARRDSSIWIFGWGKRLALPTSSAAPARNSWICALGAPAAASALTVPSSQPSHRLPRLLLVLLLPPVAASFATSLIASATTAAYTFLLTTRVLPLTPAIPTSASRSPSCSSSLRLDSSPLAIFAWAVWAPKNCTLGSGCERRGTTRAQAAGVRCAARRVDWRVWIAVGS